MGKKSKKDEITENINSEPLWPHEVAVTAGAGINNGLF